MKPERQLRYFQITCLVFVALSIWVLGRFPVHFTGRAISFSQWIVVLCATYCVLIGFWIQRRVLRANRSGKRRSTLLGRWRAGHVLRLASAVSVCLWAFVLRIIGGPTWLVNTIFAVGVILLLVWRPGTRPVETEPQA